MTKQQASQSPTGTRPLEEHLILGRDVKVGDEFPPLGRRFIVDAFHRMSSPLGAERTAVDREGRTVSVFDDHPVSVLRQAQ